MESLGIQFDKPIISWLNNYLTKKIISAKNNFNNQYIFEILFKN